MPYCAAYKEITADKYVLLWTFKDEFANATCNGDVYVQCPMLIQ